MRIISGLFKGRTITIPDGIRPVSLRVKKACFDIIYQVIKGSRVLDLFTGSGSLGLEALSLGAKSAIFVDYSIGSTTAVKTNIATLKPLIKTDVILKDSIDAIKDFSYRKLDFDLIFIDPPYYQGTITKALHAIREYDIVAPFGHIVCFCSTKDVVPESEKNLELIAKKKYGQTYILIYNKNSS